MLESAGALFCSLVLLLRHHGYRPQLFAVSVAAVVGYGGFVAVLHFFSESEPAGDLVRKLHEARNWRRIGMMFFSPSKPESSAGRRR